MLFMKHSLSYLIAQCNGVLYVSLWNRLLLSGEVYLLVLHLVEHVRGGVEAPCSILRIHEAIHLNSIYAWEIIILGWQNLVLYLYRHLIINRTLGYVKIELLWRRPYESLCLIHLKSERLLLLHLLIDVIDDKDLRWLLLNWRVQKWSCWVGWSHRLQAIDDRKHILWLKLLHLYRIIISKVEILLLKICRLWDYLNWRISILTSRKIRWILHRLMVCCHILNAPKVHAHIIEGECIILLKKWLIDRNRK
jgi:hypothetical protein